MNGHASPRLGTRFVIHEGELTIFGRDGQPFRTPAEMAAEREAAERQAAEERERSAKLAAKLRELGVDPDAV